MELSGKVKKDELIALAERQIIIIADEIDELLHTKKQKKILYNLCSWPQKEDANLVVVTIGNDMSFLEKVDTKIASRMGSN